MRRVPIMPEEYKGEVTKGCGYTNTQPRKWSESEIEWIKSLKEQGYNTKEIAESVDRTEVSVSIKLKRLKKKDDTYNEEHLEDKYLTNHEFLKIIKPKTVLDLYCGVKSFYKANTSLQVTSNDMDKDIVADYHENAELLIHKLYYDGNKYDLIDLDPFGSAYECFDLAIKMAKKGLIITFGEEGHKRFKRLDFVERYYGIMSLDDFTTENLIKHIQMIGLRNKKALTPVIVKEWDRISRVYFSIETYKVIKQWDKNIK